MTTSYYSESFDTDDEINFYDEEKNTYKEADKLSEEIIKQDLRKTSEIVSNLNNDEESQKLKLNENKLKLNEKTPILKRKKIQGSDEFINSYKSSQNKKINKLLFYYACFLSTIIICMTILIVFIIIIILLDFLGYVQLNIFNYKNSYNKNF